MPAPLTRLLVEGDEPLLRGAAEGLFDGPMRAEAAAALLADPRHRICVAIVGGSVVGFASGFVYLPPGKPAELFVSEVAVAPAFRQRGFGTAVVTALLAAGQEAGCDEAWVLADPDNEAARSLYRKCGRVVEAPQILFTFRKAGAAGPGT